MIRGVDAGDRDAIAALHLARWRDAYRGVLPDGFLDGGLADELGTLWAERDLGRTVTLVSHAADGLDGFACCLTDRAVPYVDNLHVRPGRRRSGTGDALMRALFARLREASHQAAELTVLEGNARARAFYRQQGGIEGVARAATLVGHPIREVPVRFAL